MLLLPEQQSASLPEETPERTQYQFATPSPPQPNEQLHPVLGYAAHQSCGRGLSSGQLLGGSWRKLRGIS